jgi:hypothetical protein
MGCFCKRLNGKVWSWAFPKRGLNVVLFHAPICFFALSPLVQITIFPLLYIFKIYIYIYIFFPLE